MTNEGSTTCPRPGTRRLWCYSSFVFALCVCVACSNPAHPDRPGQAPETPTGDTTSIRDDGEAVWGQRTTIGPRRTSDTELVVVPQSADLEASASINFQVYDLEDGESALAVHLPFALDNCPNIGYAVSVREFPETVFVTLHRGTRRGTEPCPAQPNYNPSYGVVIVNLAEPLGSRTVLSVT